MPFMNDKEAPIKRIPRWNTFLIAALLFAIIVSWMGLILFYRPNSETWYVPKAPAESHSIDDEKEASSP